MLDLSIELFSVSLCIFVLTSHTGKKIIYFEFKIKKKKGCCRYTPGYVKSRMEKQNGSVDKIQSEDT